MNSFDMAIQCEEVYTDQPEPVVEECFYVSENTLMHVVHINGKLKQCFGNRVKAELVELNIVKVTCSGFTDYLQLDENLKWLGVDGR